LGTALLFPVLPFLYISVSPATTVLPSLLFTSLIYGVLTALLFSQRALLKYNRWVTGLCATMAVLHFLCFSTAIFQQAKTLERETSTNATAGLERPLLSSVQHQHQQRQRQPTTNNAATAASIALSNVANAAAMEQEQRHRRGYGTLQLLNIARPHRHWLYYACAVLLVRLPLSLSIPHWVAETITCLISSDYMGAQKNIIFLCIAGTGDALLDFWCVYLFGVAQQRIIRGLRLNLFQAILRQDISFFDTTKTGEITSRMTADCAEMANDLTSVFRFTIESLVRIGGIIAYMFVRSWRLGLLALAIIPITSMINRIYAKFMHRNQKKVQAALANSNSIAQEAISAIRTVCSFAMEEGEYDRYASKIDVYYHLIVRQYFISGIYYAFCNTFLINTVVQASLLFYGAYLIRVDLLQAPVLLSFILYQSQLQEYFQNLFNSFTSLIKSSGAAAKVFDYIDRTPRYRNARRERGGEKKEKREGKRGEKEQEDGEEGGGGGGYGGGGHVSLQNVHFCYPSRPDSVVLNGLSLQILPGQQVALVGASGSGKSTVFSLIEHFYEAQRGQVTIDGIDVADIEHSELHRIVAMVGQEPELMSGTVESNILYGRKMPLNTLQEREAATQAMLSAAKDANAHDFIMNELPNGYQTEVGERGVQLSGGQKQRIAISRSILLNPKILLLDEATSALDAESEYLVQQALDRLMKGRTTIVVAHRLSTIQNSDVIYVMKNGNIVESGHHNELIALNDVYGALVAKQKM